MATMKRGGGGGGGDDLTPQQIRDIIARDNKKARTINRQFDELSAKRQRVEALLDNETEAMWANTVATENNQYLRTYSWYGPDQIAERDRPVLTPQGTVEPDIYLIDERDERFQDAVQRSRDDAMYRLMMQVQASYGDENRHSYRPNLP